MALIALLVSLFLERLLGSLAELRRFRWFARWSDWVYRHLPAGPVWEGPVAVLLVVGLPVLLVGWLVWLLNGIWLLFGLIAAVLVLLYSFGPADLEAQTEAYLDALSRDDESSAAWHAQALLGEAVPPERRGRAVMESVLVGVHEQLLGIFFWFVVLGPAGALLYRLSALLSETKADGEENAFADAARRLHTILAWVPVRLCALGFAFSGSFVDALQQWRHEPCKWADINRGVLVCVGLGALQSNPGQEEGLERREELADIRETLGLARRTVYVWLAVLALMTLVGWTS